MGLIEKYRQEKLEKVLEILNDEQSRKNIESGIFGDTCRLSNFDVKILHKTGDMLTMDGTTLEINGVEVATLEARMGCWVLDDGFLGVKLSPEQLPIINGMPTISYQQYKYMCEYVQPQFEMSKTETEKDDMFSLLGERESSERAFSFVMERYNNIPKAVMDILKQMDKHPTETEMQKFCSQKGDNKGFVIDGKIPVSFNDLIVCTFGENVKRIPELEVDPKTTNNQEKNTPNLDDGPDDR
jgi:hypothetical protein